MTAKPLLIIQWAGQLSRDQYAVMNKVIGEKIAPYGWGALVLDNSHEQIVKVYAPDGQPIEDAESVIQTLRKRLAELADVTNDKPRDETL